MTRMKLILGASGLLGFVACVSMALSQDDDLGPPPIRGNRSRPPVFNPNEVPQNEDQPFKQFDSRDPIQPYPGNQPVRFDTDGTMHPHRVKKHTRTVVEYMVEPLSDDEVKENEVFCNALQSLKDAKNDDARKKATAVIQKHLAKKFEEDQQQREKELAEAEERVKTLRKQFDKRKAAKDEIIALRLKTLINNAEGLGFPGDEDGQNREGFPGGPGAYYMPPSFGAPYSYAQPFSPSLGSGGPRIYVNPNEPAPLDTPNSRAVPSTYDVGPLVPRRNPRVPQPDDE